LNLKPLIANLDLCLLGEVVSRLHAHVGVGADADSFSKRMAISADRPALAFNWLLAG